MNNKITPEKEADILNYYLTNKDNRVVLIAKMYGVSESTVSRIINAYFDSKFN